MQRPIWIPMCFLLAEVQVLLTWQLFMLEFLFKQRPIHYHCQIETCLSCQNSLILPPIAGLVLCLIFLFSFQPITVMVVLVIHLHATLFMPAYLLCHFAVTIHQHFPIHCYASFQKFLSDLFKNYRNCNIIQLLCNIIFSISWDQQLLFCYLSYLTH